MATKEQELIDGCFARAGIGEHLFVLRQTDPATPAVIRFWADLYHKRKLAEGVQGRELARSIIKHTEALQLADTIERIQTELAHFAIHGKPSWSR